MGNDQCRNSVVIITVAVAVLRLVSFKWFPRHWRHRTLTGAPPSREDRNKNGYYFLSFAYSFANVCSNNNCRILAGWDFHRPTLSPMSPKDSAWQVLSLEIFANIDFENFGMRDGVFIWFLLPLASGQLYGVQPVFSGLSQGAVQSSFNTIFTLPLLTAHKLELRQ